MAEVAEPACKAARLRLATRRTQLNVYLPITESIGTTVQVGVTCGDTATYVSNFSLLLTPPYSPYDVTYDVIGNPH